MMLQALGDRSIYVAVFTFNLLGFIAGTLLTWPSPVLPKLDSNLTLDQNPLHRVITDEEKSWIGSLSSIGGIFGPLLFLFIIEHLGRKKAALLVTVPFAASFLTAAFARYVWMFYISRVMAGIGIGAAFTVSPMYVGEVAEKHNRGLLASSTTVFIFSGCLVSYCIGPYTSILVFNIILCAFPITCFLGILFLVPESPYYLIHKNRTVEALKNLRVLRGTHGKHIDEEFQEMKNDVSKIVEGGIMDIFKSRAAIKAFFISIIIVNSQQLSGVLVIMTYTQNIFEEAGGQLDSAMSSIVVGITQFVTVFITPFVAERVGRKKLLLFSTAGIILSLSSLGVFFYLQKEDQDFDSYSDQISWLPIVSFVLFYVFYNSGMGSIPWALLSELYPLNVKSVGASITTSLYWVTGFLVNYYFSSIARAVGTGPTFWIFAGISSGTFLFVMLVLFETKGKTLQEIQDILAS